MKKRSVASTLLIFILCALPFFSLSCSDKAAAEECYLRSYDAYIKKDLDSALSLTEKSIDCDSSFFEAEFLKCKILYFKNQYDESIKLLSKLIKKYPSFTEARIWNIRCLLAKQDLSAAEEALKTELKFNQTDWRLYYLYSLVAGKQDQMDKRLSMCRKAEDMLSDGEKVYIEMSDLWLTLGIKPKALESLNKALAVSSDPEAIKKLKTFIKTETDIK